MAVHLYCKILLFLRHVGLHDFLDGFPALVLVRCLAVLVFRWLVTAWALLWAFSGALVGTAGNELNGIGPAGANRTRTALFFTALWGVQLRLDGDTF